MSKIHKTTPKDPFEFDIKIPRDMDLPFSVQLYDPGDDCDCGQGSLEPYNTAGHEFTFQIFENQLDTTVVLEFLNAEWTTSISEGQEAPEVPDIVGRIFLASELTTLDKGREYWFRFKGQDADSTNFIIGYGTFYIERY